MSFLYQAVNEYQAVEAFRRMDRLDTGDGSGNFTIDAINALVEYYHELAIDLDEPIEFDVIAWCCDWAQYGSLLDAAQEHNNDSDINQLIVEWNGSANIDDAEETEQDMLEWFRDHTTVIEFDGGVLIQNF